MSATNSTPNYGLPQYVADDKPTYLGDFNKAMLDIDTNMKTIDNKAESAESSVSTAVSTANQALENANSADSKAEAAQATAGEAQVAAAQAQNKATAAETTANSAKSKAENAENTSTSNSELIENIQSWTSLGDIKANGSGNLNAYINKELNLLNIYGRLNGLTGAGTNVKIGSLPATARPKATRRINGVAFTYYGTGASQNLILFDLDILTNGDIVIPDNVTETIYSLRMNCILNTTGWF